MDDRAKKKREGNRRKKSWRGKKRRRGHKQGVNWDRPQDLTTLDAQGAEIGVWLLHHAHKLAFDAGRVASILVLPGGQLTALKDSLAARSTSISACDLTEFTKIVTAYGPLKIEVRDVGPGCARLLDPDGEVVVELVNMRPA